MEICFEMETNMFRIGKSSKKSAVLYFCIRKNRLETKHHASEWNLSCYIKIVPMFVVHINVCPIIMNDENGSVSRMMRKRVRKCVCVVAVISISSVTGENI